MSATSIIIRREYLERVTKKSFLVTTLLVPVLMLLMAAIPSLIMIFATGSTKNVVVIDDSGIVQPKLADTDNVRFISAFGSQEEMLANDSIFGILTIDRNILSRSSGVKLLTPNASSMTLEEDITEQINKILDSEKLKTYNIEDLDKILAQVHTNITLQTIRTDKAGEEGENQSAAVSSLIGTALNLVLYMFLLLYGSLVMNSIVEEKTNRVLEIVVSSIKPTSLMMGKIVGVGLVALTQIVIWGVIMVLISSTLLPAILPADMIAEASAINAGTADLTAKSMDADLAVALGIFTNAALIAKMFGLMIIFLIGGYLIYAAIFAAIGASVDNLQDASQLQIIGLAPIMIALFASLAVVADPNSTFAVVMSLIPLTSPMVMMARLPFGVPSWELIVAILLLVVSIIFMVWFAAKVYRVGIFMYGKKPTVRDLIRWSRYK